MTFKEYELLINILNESDYVLSWGGIRIYDGDNEVDYHYMYTNDTAHIKIYKLEKGTHNITIKYEDYRHVYFNSNTTLTIDIKDTININSTFYNTSVCNLQILDYEGKALENANATFYTDEKIIKAHTGKDGYLDYDFNMMPGTYEITVENEISGQRKTFTMEILEIYENKKALIDVYRENYKFIINASDITEKRINSGNILVKDSWYTIDSAEIVNGTATYIYDVPTWATEKVPYELNFVLTMQVIIR